MDDVSIMRIAKIKTTFYEHKQGKCHYSIFEMEKSIVSYLQGC